MLNMPPLAFVEYKKRRYMSNTTYMNEEEIWLPVNVDGFEEFYQVSSYGRVKSMDRLVIKPDRYRPRLRKGILLKTNVASTGYPVVTLCANGKATKFCIHRLVALAFIDNPNNYPCVDHINTIKTVNRVSNLRWCTYKMNSNNPISRVNLSHSLRKSGWKTSEKLMNRPDLSKPVAQIDALTNRVIKVFPSFAEAARETGLNKGNIECCAIGIPRKICGKLYYRNTVGGYKWKLSTELTKINEI